MALEYKMLHCAQLLKSRPTLYNSMDYSPPGSSVHGGSPGKNTGVGCPAFLQGIFPQPRDRTGVSHIAGGFFTSWATREAQEYRIGKPIPSPAALPDPGIKPRSPVLQADPLPAELLGKPGCNYGGWEVPRSAICKLETQKRQWLI